MDIVLLDGEYYVMMDIVVVLVEEGVGVCRVMLLLFVCIDFWVFGE